MTYLDKLHTVRERLASDAATFRLRRDMHGESVVLAELRTVTHEAIAWDNAAAGRQGKVLRLIGPGVTSCD